SRRRRHTRWPRDWSSDVCSSDLRPPSPAPSSVSPRAELPRVPVLLLAGGHDLSTPLAGARAQAALAPDGRLLVVPTAGHSVQNRAAGDPAEAELARFLG